MLTDYIDDERILRTGSRPPFVQLGMRLRTDADEARWWEVESLAHIEFACGAGHVQATLRSNDARRVVVSCSELRRTWTIAEDFDPEGGDA